MREREGIGFRFHEEEGNRLDSSKRESIGLSFYLREEIGLRFEGEEGNWPQIPLKREGIDLRFEGEEGNRLQIPRRQTKRLFESPI